MCASPFDDSMPRADERRKHPRRKGDRTLAASEKHHRQRAENLAKLVEITAYMNSTIVLEDLLSRIMSASKRVVNADASSLFLVEETTGELTPVIIEGGAGGKLKKLPRLRTGQGIAGWVAQQGQPELIEDAYAHPKFDPAYDRQTGYQTRSMICVPIKTAENIIGVSQVINKLDGSRFDQSDLELFEAFCAQAAIAIENARMHQALMIRQRLEQDLLFAKTVQQSFLPQHLPDPAGYAFAVDYVAAQNVGGDFYDFIEFPDQRLGIVVGDVSGKGVAAALYMAKLMSDFRFIAMSEPDSARGLSRLNNLLVERSRHGMFVTLLYVLLELDRHTATIINAGHLPPLIRRGKTGRVATLDASAGSPLGILPDMPFEAVRGPFEPGDTMLLYTDGVMEARNMDQEQFGMERVRRVFSDTAEPERVLRALQQSLKTFMGTQPQHDDMTLLCLGAHA